MSTVVNPQVYAGQATRGAQQSVPVPQTYAPGQATVMAGMPTPINQQMHVGIHAESPARPSNWDKSRRIRGRGSTTCGLISSRSRWPSTGGRQGSSSPSTCNPPTQWRNISSPPRRRPRKTPPSAPRGNHRTRTSPPARMNRRGRPRSGGRDLTQKRRQGRSG